MDTGLTSLALGSRATLVARAIAANTELGTEMMGLCPEQRFLVDAHFDQDAGHYLQCGAFCCWTVVSASFGQSCGMDRPLEAHPWGFLPAQRALRRHWWLLSGSQLCGNQNGRLPRPQPVGM